MTNLRKSAGPSSRLLTLFKSESVTAASESLDNATHNNTSSSNAVHQQHACFDPPGGGLDLDIGHGSSTAAPSATAASSSTSSNSAATPSNSSGGGGGGCGAPESALYETCYVTAHKAACRAGAFNSTGQLVATGSEDSSIKILDVERMLAKSVLMMASSAAGTTSSSSSSLGGVGGGASMNDIGGGDNSVSQQQQQQLMETHPVIRTLYDHQREVSCIDFYPDPAVQLLASGSKDCSIKLFDFSNPSVKKAHKNIAEAAPIRSLHFHPAGTHLLVGVHHQTLRLYDVNTSQCFVSAVPDDQHRGPITMVRWARSGRQFVTASQDGAFKVWDGVSCRCVNTFERAHDGFQVCSAVFSRNGKYVLTAGKDSLVKLWELSTGRSLITYSGAGTTSKQQHRSTAVFNHTEDFVLFPDETTKSLCCWDSRNADRQRLLSLNHNAPIRCFIHSPTGPAFISCSDDYRARFWFKRSLCD